MSEWPGIEFARWVTPIENDSIYLVDVTFGDGSFWTSDSNGRSFEVPPSRPNQGDGVLAIFFSIEQEALYEVRFYDAFTFRVLDEHGLVELWNATAEQGGRPGQATFRVRNHGWHRESELSFIMSGADYSYVLASNTTCLEVVTGSEPRVRFVRKVPATTRPTSSFDKQRCAD
jgi:hypothetical protein